MRSYMDRKFLAPTLTLFHSHMHVSGIYPYRVLVAHPLQNEGKGYIWCLKDNIQPAWRTSFNSTHKYACFQ